MSPITRQIRRSLLVFLALLLVAAPPSVAQSEGPSMSEEIVKMLEAEMPEEVILEWLEGAPVPTTPLSADEMVAVKRAGASTDLLKALLEWSRRPPRVEGSPAAVPTPPVEAPPETAPSPPAPPVAASSGGLVPVTFEISYLARFEDPDPVFDMFVYLDGIPVTFITTNEFESSANRMEFSWPLPPGDHVLRITQERHFKRLTGKRWTHETRVAREDFAFRLDAGQPATLTVEFIERMMEWRDPLSFSLAQGERVVDKGPTGGEAEFWPLLCEDIEVSVPEGKKPSRNQRKKLEGCVRWRTLWGESEVPDRGEILRVMADFDFQPVPRGS